MSAPAGKSVSSLRRTMIALIVAAGVAAGAAAATKAALDQAPSVDGAAVSAPAIMAAPGGGYTTQGRSWS